MTDRIEIAVVGDISRTIVEGIAETVTELFDAEAVISAASEEECESAYDRKRKQYSASMLLFCMGMRRKGTVMKSLVIIDRDIYLPEFNYIFGFSDEAKSIAVTSLARLRKKGDASSEGSGKLLDRATKTSVHELGHIYGLSHCRDHRCVMFFSFNLSDTDYKGKDLCPQCRGVLDRKRTPCITEAA